MKFPSMHRCSALDDTCVAMREWVANPTASTNLDDILPCVDPNQANQTLRQTTAIAATITNFTNTVITAANRDIPRQLPIWYNASGPPVPLLDQSGPVNFTSADAVRCAVCCLIQSDPRLSGHFENERIPAEVISTILLTTCVCSTDMAWVCMSDRCVWQDLHDTGTLDPGNISGAAQR